LFYLVLISTFFIFARKWLKQGPDLAATPPVFTARASGQH